METLELQGAKLRYHQVGQGPVLIFIPGANVPETFFCLLQNS